MLTCLIDPQRRDQRKRANVAGHGVEVRETPPVKDLNPTSAYGTTGASNCCLAR